MSRLPEYIKNNYVFTGADEVTATFRHKYKLGRRMELVRRPDGTLQGYRTKWGKYTVPAAPDTTEALIAMAAPHWPTA